MPATDATTTWWKKAPVLIGAALFVGGIGAHLWVVASWTTRVQDGLDGVLRAQRQTSEQVQQVASQLATEVDERKGSDVAMREEHRDDVHRLELAITTYHGAVPAPLGE